MTASLIYAIIVVSTCFSILILTVAHLLFRFVRLTDLTQRKGLGLVASPAVGTDSESGMPGLPGIPKSLTDWMEGESEPWARQELQSDASRLYSMTNDWTLVELELRRRHSSVEASPEVAAGVAWEKAGTEFVDDSEPQE